MEIEVHIFPISLGRHSSWKLTENHTGSNRNSRVQKEEERARSWNLPFFLTADKVLRDVPANVRLSNVQIVLNFHLMSLYSSALLRGNFFFTLLFDSYINFVMFEFERLQRHFYLNFLRVLIWINASGPESSNYFIFHRKVNIRESNYS